jgi:O-antigen/teichoic acid export membrane protein
MKLAYITFILSIFLISSAYAYIGPGMAAGAIAVILGIVGAILVALFTVLYYPIKKTIQKIKKTKQQNRDTKKN